MQGWAQSHDFHILDYFEDSSISGKTAAIGRKGFQELLKIVALEALLTW